MTITPSQFRILRAYARLGDWRAVCAELHITIVDRQAGHVAGLPASRRQRRGAGVPGARVVAMTDHICQIHGAPCRGRDSQDGANLSTLTPVEEAELTARANAAAAEVADDLVNQRTRTA